MLEKQKEIIINSLRTIISALEWAEMPQASGTKGVTEVIEEPSHDAFVQQEVKAAAIVQQEPSRHEEKPHKRYSVERKPYCSKHAHDVVVSGNKVLGSLNIVFEPGFVDKAGLAGQRVLVEVVNESMLALKFSKSGYKLSDTANTVNGGIRVVVKNKDIFNCFYKSGLIPSEFDAEKIEKKGIWILTKNEAPTAGTDRS